MEKNMKIIMLMDFYGQLLTEKQYDALDMYYNQDLSLAEIAEESMISRQGARDFIKKGERLLNGYEEKLGLVKRFGDITKQIGEMNEIIDRLKNDSNSAEIERLKEISRNLSEEI